jgi:hypothetical protein
MSRHRNFGVMSSRLRLGGTSTQPAATRDAIQTRGLDSDPFLPLLPSSYFSQTFRDVFTMLRVAMLVFAAGLAVFFTLLIIVFVGG